MTKLAECGAASGHVALSVTVRPVTATISRFYKKKKHKKKGR